MSECTEIDCNSPTISRGLCSKHYQRAKYHNALPPLAIPRACEECGKPLAYAGRGAPPKFCSRPCKDAAKWKRKKAEAHAERGERRCLTCNAALSDSLPLQTKCCSKKCRWTYENRKKAERKLAEAAPLGNCQNCGAQLVYAGHGARPTKWCSRKCRNSSEEYKELYRQPGWNTAYMRKRLYGITEEEYAALMEKQGHVCAVCGSEEWPGKSNSPHVDHCHNSSRVRGILCGKCNTGLGQFDDDPARLRAAADYLEAAVN